MNEKEKKDPDAAVKGISSTLASSYKWIEDTHTSPIRLIVWTGFVILTAILFKLSPVLSAFFLLFSVNRAQNAGDLLESVLSKRFKTRLVIALTFITPIAYGIYFLVAMKLFELDLDSIDFRPTNPGRADLVNFVGGLITGVLVIIRYKSKLKKESNDGGSNQ